MAVVVLRRATPTSNGQLGQYEAGYANSTTFITQVSGDGQDLTYRFPFAPVEVTYDSVGADYQTIDRPGEYALIDRRAPNLLKASFEFRVAHRPSNGLQPIDRDIEYLRRIASQDKSVAISGLGGFFDGSTFLSTAEQGNVLFRVMDISIRIVRRGLDNQPWQADCRLDLIEDRNPSIASSTIASIVYETVPTAKTTSTRRNGNKGNDKPSTDPPPVVYVSTHIDAAASYRRKNQ